MGHTTSKLSLHPFKTMWRVGGKEPDCFAMQGMVSKKYYFMCTFKLNTIIINYLFQYRSQLSFNPYDYPSIWQSMYQNIYSSKYNKINSIYVFIHLFIYPTIYPAIYLSSYQCYVGCQQIFSVYLFIYLEDSYGGYLCIHEDSCDDSSLWVSNYISIILSIQLYL